MSEKGVLSNMEEADCRLQRVRTAGRAVYELVFRDEVLEDALDDSRGPVLSQ